MLINVTEQLLNADNFTDEMSWYELLKMEVDELLSTIKKISKLTWIATEPKRLRSLVKCLAECRTDILKTTELIPVKKTDSTADNNSVNIVANDSTTSDLHDDNTVQVIDTTKSAIACDSQDLKVNEIDNAADSICSDSQTNNDTQGDVNNVL